MQELSLPRRQRLQDNGSAAERLTCYASDLNLGEGIWNYLRRVEPKNRCCTDLTQLRIDLRQASERLRHTHHIIRSRSVY